MTVVDTRVFLVSLSRPSTSNLVLFLLNVAVPRLASPGVRKVVVSMFQLGNVGIGNGMCGNKRGILGGSSTKYQ